MKTETPTITERFLDIRISVRLKVLDMNIFRDITSSISDLCATVRYLHIVPKSEKPLWNVARNNSKESIIVGQVEKTTTPFEDITFIDRLRELLRIS